jgi:ABC-type cobalamin/Fe3+-siderophores transport system ATPase subunit
MSLTGLKFELKNYRRFSDSYPAQFELRPGFTGIVGTNNAGKSSLMKFFREFRNYFASSFQSRSDMLEALKGNTRGYPGLLASEPGEVFCNFNDRPLSIEFDFSDPKYSTGTPLRSLMITVNREALNWTAVLVQSDGTPLRDDSCGFEPDDSFTLRGRKVCNFRPFFEDCSVVARSIFVGAFRNVVNIGAAGEYFDIQTGQAFISQWRQLKTGPSRRTSEATYKLTADLRRIFELDELDINTTADDQDLQVYADGRSYLIGEMGSGIVQFLILLANVLTKRPSYIFIDEPELNLHPSLQIDFLTTLASYTEDGVCFASHSIGLVRAIAEHQYSLRKKPDGSELRPLQETPRLTELLGELSFSGYRELGFDHVLLVEGITDVPSIQQFLLTLGKGHEILVLPLGGASFINERSEQQLSELTRLSSSIYCVIDSERSTAGAPLSAEREGFVRNCRSLGITCHVTDLRATENYFPDRAVKAALGPSYSSLGPYEKLDGQWPKSRNWRIAAQVSESELLASDLGVFLGQID